MTHQKNCPKTENRYPETNTGCRTKPLQKIDHGGESVATLKLSHFPSFTSSPLSSFSILPTLSPLYHFQYFPKFHRFTYIFPSDCFCIIIFCFSQWTRLNKVRVVFAKCAFSFCKEIGRISRRSCPSSVAHRSSIVAALPPLVARRPSLVTRRVPLFANR